LLRTSQRRRLTITNYDEKRNWIASFLAKTLKPKGLSVKRHPSSLRLSRTTSQHDVLTRTRRFSIPAFAFVVFRLCEERSNPEVSLSRSRIM